MSLKERVQFLCKQKGVTAQQVEEQLVFAKGYISKLDKSTPNSSRLQKIADYFNVSYDYLMTGEKETPSTAEGEGLSAVQQEALNFIKTLTDEQLKRFIAMGRAAFENREEP